jgi:endonuclease III
MRPKTSAAVSRIEPMAPPPQPEAIVDVLLARYGQTFAAELGIPIARNTPSPLFRLLCAALLCSARIRADIAIAASRALVAQGWTTARKLAASSWEERTATLNAAGYGRYDERTATMLGETADLVLTEYGGDLRHLRDAAGRDPSDERRRLKVFKGIGDVGADIFLRDVQLVWDELYPFADRIALESAKRLGLPDTADGLANLIEPARFPNLVSALVRVTLAKTAHEIREAAGRGISNGP